MITCQSNKISIISLMHTTHTYTHLLYAGIYDTHIHKYIHMYIHAQTYIYVHVYNTYDCVFESSISELALLIHSHTYKH